MKELKALKPTDGELEILQILWSKGQATVRTVFEEINQSRESGYTTTLKLMQIMLEKEMVTRDTSSKMHIYKPAITKERTQKQFVGKLVSNLFAGSTTQLVLQALGNHKPDASELQEIENFIRELKKQ